MKKRFFYGVELKAYNENKAVLLETVLSVNARAKVFEGEDGSVLVVVSPKNAKKIAVALDKSNILVYINNVCVINNILSRIIMRPGLILGAIMFLALLFFSTAFVFKVEVKGDVSVGRDEVRKELVGLGVCAGARISDINCPEITAKFLDAHSEFSWASVNVYGTTVVLELKSRETVPEINEKKHSLLVADCNGVIRYLTVSSGKPLVKVGEPVKKGDLLVCGYVSGSGLQYSDDPILRYYGAAGKVYAEVYGSVEAFSPFSEVAESKTDVKTSGICISVFGCSFTFGDFKTDVNSRVSATRNVTVFGLIELPVTYSVCTKNETVQNAIVRSEVEAEATATQEAFLKLEDLLDGATLEWSETLTETTETGVRVTVNYRCVKNIAVPKDIENKG